jgi:hypothetical protein
MSEVQAVSPVLLFDNVQRQFKGPAGHVEPHFTYLNRSGRPDVASIRERLEVWFSRYPKDDQTEMRARFRSKKDPHHHAAFFELFLHELLLGLGCQVTVHPTAARSERRPDFLVKSRSGDGFYLEAVVATGESEQAAAQRARVGVVYDALDRMTSPNFFIGVQVRGALKTAPPAKNIRAYIEKRLARLDPDEIAERHAAAGRLPLRWNFEHGGWRITFMPIPKSRSGRGKPGVRPIGAMFGQSRYVAPEVAVRDAILGKAGRYGDLDGLPYVIAVNALTWPTRQADVLDALFGRVQVTVKWDPTGPDEPEASRYPDGVWTSGSGPKNTRVSAVLVLARLDPWRISNAEACLYLNPWALSPYTSELTQLQQAIVEEDGSLAFREGKSTGTVLQLPPTWP